MDLTEDLTFLEWHEIHASPARLRFPVPGVDCTHCASVIVATTACGDRSWSHPHHSLILSGHRQDRVGVVPRGDRENTGCGELPEVGWSSRYVSTPNIQGGVLNPSLALNFLCTILVGR